MTDTDVQNPKLLRDGTIPMNPRHCATMVINDVFSVTNVPPSKIMSKRRADEYCRARFIAYLTLASFGLGNPEIGELMGKHRGAISNGINEIKNRSTYEKQTKRYLELMRLKGYQI